MADKTTTLTVNTSADIEVTTDRIINNYETEKHNFIDENVPEWLIHIFLTILTFGAIVNALVILTLVRCRRNGMLCLLLQMSTVDILSVYVAVVEIITVSQNNWIFSNFHCQIYKGTEVSVNTLIVYLIVSLNFHAISMWNLHKSEPPNKKNPLTSNLDVSDECLVTKNENANRIINIDYRRKNNDISIVIPSITVWFLSISLSLPTFAFSSTIRFSYNQTFCEIIDLFQARGLQNLMITFKVIIPIVLLIITSLIVVYKLCTTSYKDIDNVLTKKFIEIRKVLTISLIISILFMTTSFQRYCLELLYIYKPIVMFLGTKNRSDVHLLQYDFLDTKTVTYLSMLHYVGILIRGFIYLYMLVKVWNIIRCRRLKCIK